MTKRNLVRNVFSVCVLISIITSGILLNQDFICMIPLCISVFIMLFQSQANRYAYLIGGLNAIIYFLVDNHLGLYASAASDILFSFPIQVLTFLNWHKHAHKNSVVFKKMNLKQLSFTAIAFLTAWIVQFIVLIASGSNYAFLDNTSALLGILVSILTMLAFIEYTYIWIIQGAISILLRIQLVVNDFSQLSYLIMTVYSFIYIVIAFFTVREKYNEQRFQFAKATS